MIPVKGYAALKAKSQLVPFDFQRRELGPKDVLIDIHYCGICHSDVHQVGEELGSAIFPMVPGHEIVGLIEQIGTEIKRFQIGDRVGVGCFVDSCRQCTHCREGLEQYCDEGMTLTYNDRERGSEQITQGGYSTKIVVNEDYILRLPSNLPMAETAPLLCAGITLYSPLMHWQAGPNKKVAIVGLGGLGHMGVKLAHALQAEVSVLSHSSSKKTDSERLGAQNFYSTQDEKIFSDLANTFNLILCTVSAKIDWNKYINLLKRDGTMILLGVPAEQIPVGASYLIGGRRRLAGSLIGGIQETQELLDFCGTHQITADVEIIPIQKVNEAYERMLKSDVKYRFVIDVSSLKE